jgi:hypothetical protein
MALLADYGLVIQTARYTYQIADGVQQLPLMVMELDDGEDEPEPENVIDSEFRSQKLRAEDAPQSNLSDESEIRSQKMRPNSTNKPPNSARSQKFRARSQNLRPAPLASSTTNLNQESKDLKLLASTPVSKKQQEILDCLDRYGVREPTRSNLARMEHVSAALIDFHFHTAPNIRLAIYRIKNNWEIEQEKVDQQNRFTTGKFKEFIHC